MNFNRALNRIIIFLAVVFLWAGEASAQLDIPGVDDNSGTVQNPIPHITSIPELIKIILEGLIKIGIPIVAIAIIYSGFLFVSARGNSGELEKAKRALFYTLIGAAVLLGSWAIAQMISETILQL